jgi:hypothetical protein
VNGRPTRKPRYTLHGDFRMPLGFPVEGFRSGLRYAPQAGDIFVATYPKCGTTWMQYIVYLLLRDGRGLAPGERLDAVFPHLEEVGKQRIEALPEPRLIKTHLPFDRTPWHAAAKYIVVARNPFDCVVSFYHHTRGFVRHYDFADGTLDDFFECFIAGEVDFGDYFDHLLSWYPQEAEPNVLFTTYEAMLADPRAAITAVGEFLGGAAAATLRTGAALETVLAQSSFGGMRERQDRWSSPRPDGMPAFVRKGEVGGWRRELSREQVRRLVARFVERTRGTRAADLWSDQLTAARGIAGEEERA